MRSNWTKYKERLQAVANNRSYGGSNGVALIMINCFVSESVLLFWYKPQRISLEPREFDISPLKNGEAIGDWLKVIGLLIECAKTAPLIKVLNGREVRALDKTLIVKDAIPVGWLVDPQT